MKDVIELETRIAQITVSSAERRDEEKLYHALTIADLRNLAPFVSFQLMQIILCQYLIDFFVGQTTARLERILSIGLWTSQHLYHAISSCRTIL